MTPVPKILSKLASDGSLLPPPEQSDPTTVLQQAIRDYRQHLATPRVNQPALNGRLPHLPVPPQRRVAEEQPAELRARAQRALDQAVISARSFLEALNRFKERLERPVSAPVETITEAQSPEAPKPPEPSRNVETPLPAEGSPAERSNDEAEDERFQTDDDRWCAYRVDLSFTGALPIPLATSIADALRTSKIPPSTFGAFLERVEALQLLPMQTRDLIFTSPASGEPCPLGLSLLEQRVDELTTSLAAYRAFSDAVPNCFIAELLRCKLLLPGDAARHADFMRRLDRMVNTAPPIDLIDPRFSVIHTPSSFAPDAIEGTDRAIAQCVEELPSELPLLFPHAGDEDAFRELVVSCNDAGDLRFPDPGALWILLRFGFGTPIQFHTPAHFDALSERLRPFHFHEIEARMRRIISDEASSDLFERTRRTVALVRAPDVRTIGIETARLLDHLAKRSCS